MPNPWEEIRKVKILYHSTDALTFINEVPFVALPRYIAQWSPTWIAMKGKKEIEGIFEG
jgi:pre-mRNA-processing factor 8